MDAIGVDAARTDLMAPTPDRLSTPIAPVIARTCSSTQHEQSTRVR